ncbi:MAG: glycosyltransferase family A protein [Microbacterium sp.]
MSIILPTNRTSPFLREALASVAEQTFASWELILVDNGVPDGDALRALVSEFDGMRVIQAPPVSLGFARNAGVVEARGELYVFHDDDDVWSPDRLRLQVEALDASPDAPASYVGGWHMDAAGTPFGPGFPATAESADDMLSGAVPTPHICGTLMVRRSAHLLVGGFAPELPIMEDFEYMLRLLELGTFACVEGQHLGYRRHDGNLTSTGWRNVAQRRAIMRASLQRLAEGAGGRGDARHERLYREHLRRFDERSSEEAGGAFVAAVRRGEWNAARSGAAWGIRRSPGRFVGAGVARVTRRNE